MAGRRGPINRVPGRSRVQSPRFNYRQVRSPAASLRLRTTAHQPSSAETLDQPHRRLQDLAPKHSEHNPLDLTLGIEIEFVLLVRKNSEQTECTEPDPFKMHGRNLVHCPLSEPLIVKCSHPACQQVHEFTLPLNSLRDFRDRYDKWTVDTDGTAQLETEERKVLLNAGGLADYEIYPLELKSRILPYEGHIPTTPSIGNPDHVHTITFDREIEAVMQRLHERLNNPSNPDIVMLVNANTALHVHLGNQCKGFPLPTLKRFLGLNVVHERLFDASHPTHRIDGFSRTRKPLTNGTIQPPGEYCINRDNLDHRPHAYNKGLAHMFLHGAYRRRCLRRYPDVRDFASFIILRHSHYPSNQFGNPSNGIEDAAFGMSRTDWLHLIDCAPGVVDLQALLNDGHHQTINLDNLDPSPGIEPASSAKTTIEMRQHCGTLASEEMIHFIHLEASCLLWAHHVSDHAYRETVTDKLADPEFRLSDLTKALGVPTPTRRYIKSLLGELPNALPDHNTLLHTHTQHRLSLYPPNSPLHALLAHNERTRHHTRAPTTVFALIKTKLLQGGYGQLPPSYFAAATSAEPDVLHAAQALAIGSANPDDPTPDPDSASTVPEQSPPTHRVGGLRLTNPDPPSTNASPTAASHGAMASEIAALLARGPSQPQVPPAPVPRAMCFDAEDGLADMFVDAEDGSAGVPLQRELNYKQLRVVIPRRTALK